ncbi:5-formyltetrahydrofolate cyclo-ligase [Butyrivibrio sp. AE3004]|uniref:5-formyltetrahydrofolate cyclo-ligase n=1 Tax=Butyrivibrio sp. AE3004 TaxID=1506994 RepID=UPI0009DCE2EC|nr:5-formyltetrahydrofolate cyclo-ligase [Butyrivibrio sp. AE3004]
MIRINSIKIINSGFEKMPEGKEEQRALINRKLVKKASKLLKINASDIKELIIKKHSIDARKKSEIMDIYVVDISLSNPGISEENIIKKSGCKSAITVKEKKYHFPNNREEDEVFKRNFDKKPARPIIVGSGPAGLFCAYELALSGYCPIVLERGMDIDKRHEAVSAFWRGEALMPDGNVQFGEGGAGTFSDGKLNTMVKDKNGLGFECLKIFHEHGAAEDILFESKPHIGTDVLRTVIKNIRNKIISYGGEFHFQTKVTSLIIEGRKVKGVKCDDNSEFLSDIVVLAIGHSARDTFYQLSDQNIVMEPKAFAVGLRAEHPQKLINRSQYGIDNPQSLPPSPYKVTARSSDGRGVYSFCMCPGGYVVNASSEDKRLCVNGMSYSARDGRNANSAIVVTVEPKDFGSDDVLSGVEFQRRLEEKAYAIANGKVPVEYFDDFKSAVYGNENTNKDKRDRNLPCIKGLWEFAPVHEILPKDINVSIVEGMEHFGKIIHGFDSDETILSGVEARTSSPVRINRDENLEAIGIEGLYPCGEGAGYAGGITSAAMDGMRVAEKIAIHYKSGKNFYRKNMADRRDKLDADEKNSLSGRIARRIVELDEYKKAKNILIYCSIGNEADTNGIINAALNDGKAVFCPKITNKKDRVMEFVRIRSKEDLISGSYSIPEPLYDKDSEIYNSDSEYTLLILPGLVFDNIGNRIGYGGGYYDNYMIRFNGSILNGIMKTIAIGYDFQVLKEDISDFMSQNDAKVNMIVTDKETFDYEHRSKH